MDKKKLKVVILGYGSMFNNLIAGCLDVGAEIVGVFRHEKVLYTPFERLLKDTFNQSEELSYIKSHNLYEIKARSANSAEFKKEILRLNADIVFVGSWSEKLKKPIIDLPTIATINAHPSLLPKYRGPNPYLQVINNFEQESGVTFHLMDEYYDTGAMLLQKKVVIKPQDTGVELKNRICSAAREGIRELLHKLHEDVIIPLEQEEVKATYYKHIHSDEVMLDFSKSAREIDAKIRAFHPWYKCFFKNNTHFFVPNPYKTEIREGHGEDCGFGEVVEKSPRNKSISVMCGDGKILKMSGLELYGPFASFYTEFYIKHRVKKFSHLN